MARSPTRTPHVGREISEQDETDSRQARRLEIERQIVRIATDAFARRGYSSPTLREITREAGVSLPVVYWFFADKRHLYTECCKRVIRESTAAINDSVAAYEDDATILVAFMESVARDHVEHYATKLLHRVMLDEDEPLLKEIREIFFAGNFFEKVVRAIRGITKTDDPELMLFSLVSFAAGFLEHAGFWRELRMKTIDPENTFDVAHHILRTTIPDVDWAAVIAENFPKGRKSPA